MLKISDLHFSLGKIQILNGVNFAVSSGERVGIIGPNGSGKTTLFNCLSGFRQITKGKIEFQDKDITNLPAYQRAELGIGRTFQNFGIFKEMTVLENMITALESARGFSLPWGRKAIQIRKQSLEYLESINLTSKLNEKASSLSGGQMRLLEIVRGLAIGFNCFLLDEPTAGVSPKMKHEITKLLLKLQEQKKTILIIEHDINFIQKLCQRIIVLDGGINVLDDTPENIRNNESLQDIYFGQAEVETAEVETATSGSTA